MIAGIIESSYRFGLSARKHECETPITHRCDALSVYLSTIASSNGARLGINLGTNHRLDNHSVETFYFRHGPRQL